VDKFVDKLMTWLISHLFVRIFSFLANFCTIKKAVLFQLDSSKANVHARLHG
jgi:hypothetical protein